MNQNRIIRPESISSEDWAALSREEQIHWWLENGWRKRQEQFSHRAALQIALREYEQGNLTRFECCNWICDVLDEQCLREILPRIPAEVLTLIKENRDAGPKIEDEEAWSNVRISYGITLFQEGITDDDIERMDWECRSEIRERKRILRRIFPTAPSR